MPEKERNKYPRKKFAYSDFKPKQAVEPPLPTSDAAQRHEPNPYINTSLHNQKIAAIRAKATNPKKDFNLNYAQWASLYPKSFPHFVRGRDSIREYITSSFTDHIVIYDSSMDTMIQDYSKRNRLEEEEYRGNRFSDWSCNVKGNNDMLSISQPQIIRNIYKEYLEVGGSSLIGTNTLSSTTVAMANYGMEDYVYELNYEGARLAREVCDEVTAKDPTKPRFVVGAIGPTNCTEPISPSVEDPPARNVTFDELVEAYFEQIVGLVDGGSDILMVEKISDTLNVKAALYAVGEYLELTGLDIPVFVSGTLVDQSGRTLSGQTAEAFYASIRHAKPMCVGLNCAPGVTQITPFVERLSAVVECFMYINSNTWTPNTAGENVDPRENTVRENETFFKKGWLNMVNGCCGSAPQRIKITRDMSARYKPRKLPDVGRPKMWLSGLDDLVVDNVHNRLGLPFLNIVESFHISESPISKKIMVAEDYGSAMGIAKKQIENGAHVIGINIDDGILDGIAVMQKIVKMAVTEPGISKVPFMLDSSKFDIVMTGVKCCQSKCIVKSISLKEGVEKFKENATMLKKHGSAIVVMALDECGQAVTEEDKIRICKQSYDILVSVVKFPAEDIIFDPNLLTIKSGMEGRENYCVDFMNAVEKIKEVCPHAKVSGGISNLSVEFCGATKIKEAINSVFLHHAILHHGMDVGIVNAHEMCLLTEINPDTLKACENLVFNRTEDATDVIFALMKKEKFLNEARDEGNSVREKEKTWRDLRIVKQIEHSFTHDALELKHPDAEEERKFYDRPLQIVAGRHMDGKNAVGDRFGSGQKFLPQVINTARAMKKAVAYLESNMHDTESK